MRGNPLYRFLFSFDEIKIFEPVTGIDETNAAFEIYSLALQKPLNESNELNFRIALGLVFAAGRFQGVREERARRKKRIERRRARSEQQPKRGNA